MYLSAPGYFEGYPGAVPEVLHVLSSWIPETGWEETEFQRVVGS